MAIATAHAKVILAGEHAVVYGHPAVAMPVCSLSCEVGVADSPDGLTSFVADAYPGRFLAGADEEHPLSFLEELLGWLFRDELPRWGVEFAGPPPLSISVRSEIPIGAGMGSSAAILVAATRALFAHYGIRPPASEIQRLAHAAEMGVHGRSSGLDVAAAVHSAPVLFTTGDPAVSLSVGAPFDLLIARSGLQSLTRKVVLDVLERRKREPAVIDGLFARMGDIARHLGESISRGELSLMGRLMNRNQELLADLGVSCPDLDRLVVAAREAGALGAKLTGAGRGGCIVALAEPVLVASIRQSLFDAGAVEVHEYHVDPQAVGDDVDLDAAMPGGRSGQPRSQRIE